MKLLQIILISIVLTSCNSIKYEVEYEKYDEANKSLDVTVHLSRFTSRSELIDISQAIKSKYPDAKKVNIDFSSEKYEEGKANYAWATFYPDLEIHSHSHPELEYPLKH